MHANHKPPKHKMRPQVTSFVILSFVISSFVISHSPESNASFGNKSSLVAGAAQAAIHQQPATSATQTTAIRNFVQLGNSTKLKSLVKQQQLLNLHHNNNKKFLASSPPPSHHIVASNLQQRFSQLNASLPIGQTGPPPAELADYYQHVMLMAHTNKPHKPKKVGLLDKICYGTSNKLSARHNKTENFQNLVERYKNCTYVIGNLEITWLDSTGPDGQSIDLSFLESIREITGHLLIAYVNAERIRMPNLQIIRGRDLFKFNEKDEFAMILIQNELKTLELPNLREILAGSFGSFNNKNLCHIRTINWDEILNWPTYGSKFAYEGSVPECAPCDSTCQGTCWGEGPDMCQKFSKIICAKECGLNRCFGPSSDECCHPFCAGGCTNRNATDCFACRNFNDDGECKQECPSLMRYNPNTFLRETNPVGKYVFGPHCVADCPEHLLKDNGACVKTCPPNTRSFGGECVPCGGPCPKNCQGVEVVHSGNIDQLINCTIIEGSITILDVSFSGYAGANQSNNSIGIKYQPMHPSRLEVFNSLREITGYLSIQAEHPDFKDLSYFRNLNKIGGRQTTDRLLALSIVKTSLVSLNLRSLRKVRSGKILIEDNKDLCFADTIDWLQLNITRKEDILTRNNAEPSRCRQLNLQCHEQCAKDGCWGPGPDECLSCNNYKLDDYCVDNCTSVQSLGLLAYVYEGNTCKKCHAECKGGCSGDDAKHCWKCKNVQDGPYCVAECPSHKYNQDGHCMNCDSSCDNGCTGPSNHLGEGGCNSCVNTVIHSTKPLVAFCSHMNETCPDSFYQEFVSPQSEPSLKALMGKPVCRRCHDRCKKCTGMGTHVTVCTCAKYVANEQCEDSCPPDYYADEQSHECIKCNSECHGCFGPTEADCRTCRKYRVYTDSYSPVALAQVAGELTIENFAPQPRFNCTAQCPPDKPHRISDSNMLDPYCSDQADIDIDAPRITSVWRTSLTFIMFIVFISAAILASIALVKHEKRKDETVKLTKHLAAFNDIEPLEQSNVRPNLRRLRSIKETELRIGKQLGSGFGGTVFQGFWQPESRKHGLKVPVAIKILRDNGQPSINKEFLNEAYNMTSVNHPNLVRLLAVCMTPNQFMLITQLMPLGCLLDFVKQQRSEIAPKNLFEWSKQIARGMAYLEENRIVHRDLALRNVLLLTPGKALISDFGLAKMLEINESEYKSGGGRLPIKWLAPECIRERKFTHQSDVWAFGVTVWELLTFGAKPFEEYEAKDVPLAIEEGARLQQPDHVSTEVYKVLIACWFYSPSERPDFKSLVEDFKKFAKDPPRYYGGDGICYNNRGGFLRACDSEENVFEEPISDEHFSDDESQYTSIAQDLAGTSDNRINETMFGNQMRHHSESGTMAHTQHLLSPTLKKLNIFQTNDPSMLEGNFFSTSVFTPSSSSKTDSPQTDMNNNFFSTNRLAMNSTGCWSAHNSISTASLSRKPEQPTDVDDYLLPSPCSDDKYDKFLTAHEGRAHRMPHLSLNEATPSYADLVGISNQNYFSARPNYVNSNEANGHISVESHMPHSLV